MCATGSWGARESFIHPIFVLKNGCDRWCPSSKPSGAATPRVPPPPGHIDVAPRSQAGDLLPPLHVMWRHPCLASVSVPWTLHLARRVPLRARTPRMAGTLLNPSRRRYKSCRSRLPRALSKPPPLELSKLGSSRAKVPHGVFVQDLVKPSIKEEEDRVVDQQLVATVPLLISMESSLTTPVVSQPTDNGDWRVPFIKYLHDETGYTDRTENERLM
jgi:hypothetical protein